MKDFCLLSGHVSQTYNHLRTLVFALWKRGKPCVSSIGSIGSVDSSYARVAVGKHVVYLDYCRFARAQYHVLEPSFHDT